MTDNALLAAAEILDAKALLPAHVGRFALARHSWDEPFERAAWVYQLHKSITQSCH